MPTNDPEWMRRYMKAYRAAGKENDTRGQHVSDAKRGQQTRQATAVRRGDRTPPKSCSRCGKAGKVQAHHPGKGDRVQYLCAMCHAKVTPQRNGR